MSELRILSLLPAATEMVYALGLGDALVGVSHECDFPLEAKLKAIVVKPVLALEQMTLREIDVAVAERIGSGQSLYAVDEPLVRELRPNLVLTQNLCEVCGPAGNEISDVLKWLQPKPDILWMTPHRIAEIFDNLRELGNATGCESQAESLIAAAHERLAQVQAVTSVVGSRPRVFCLEWVEPYYCCGHWVPEMIALAGGVDELGRLGVDSVRIAWSDIAAWAPEVVIVAPCGFDLGKAVEQTEQLLRQPGWSELPAVKSGRVFAVNANAYFARPGPRVVDGVELLAHLIHPELCAWHGPSDAFQQVTTGSPQPMPVRVKVCAQCQTAFSCGPQPPGEHCWCDALPPLPLSAIQAGADCWCPACLAELAATAVA